MPGCAAVGCNNRSEKGYIMKCFPRDPKLRKIWQDRVARADWEPSNNSFLCHVHFEPQEWAITQSGRIRLKKNAIPSIFTITSTRKSPKKRIKLTNAKKEAVLHNDISIESLENDTEYSSTGHLEEKDSDFQDIDERSLHSIDMDNKDHSDFPEADVIMISDDDLDAIGTIIKEDNSINSKNSKNYNRSKVNSPLTIGNTINSRDLNMTLKETKMEAMDHNIPDDSYDEIEEKLKQICDGGSTEDEHLNSKSKIHLSIKNSKGSGGKSDEKLDLTNDGTKFALPQTVSIKNEVGHILTDKRENVEIIFGAESGDEKSQICHTALYNKHLNLKTDKLEGIIKEEKVFTEDIEENFSKDEVHVIPNMRAAMKRKKRTREEIMKSIKKSIKSASDQDAISSSNSDASESIEANLEIRNKPITLQNRKKDVECDDAITETNKFIIKVTGDATDVSEIMEELSYSTMGKQIAEKITIPCENEENDGLITSIITVISPKDVKKPDESDMSIVSVKDECTSLKKPSEIQHSPPGEKIQICIDSVHSLAQCNASCCRYAISWSDEEDKSLVPCPHMQKCSHATAANSSVNCISSDYEDLLERIKIQEDVITKLTDQIIIYKDLENNLKNKNVLREAQSKELDMAAHKMNTRSSTAQAALINKKNLDSKQRLIDDLSNRVNYFEEINKKLMKTVTLESQQKRKLEGQIKQKENRIKELNWKLEKASKYLERAEKNTNTYRRKMLNMQTIMRRKKLLDEKMSRFNEMLIDSSKQDFSEKALNMAIEIRKTCGRHGYDKLLSYGFPLPPLPALRKRCISDDFTDFNESDVDKAQNTATKEITIKTEKTEGIKEETEIDTKDSGLSESVTKETEFDGAETVTGTVQDIFDENNDGDDFSTNELREHFILQLNAVM